MADNLNHIDKLKEELYSKQRSGTRYRRGSLHKRDNTPDVPTEWKEEKPKEAPPKKDNSSSMFKKFFIFSIIILIAAVGFAAYKFFVGSNTVSNENVGIEIDGPRYFSGGESADVQVTVSNENAVPIEFATLSLIYPEGSDGELEGDFVRARREVSAIPAGRSHTEAYSIVLFGGQGTEKEIRASLEYRVRGSNAIFVKEATFPVTISSSPIELSVNAPQNMSSNQTVTLDVNTLINAFDSDESLRVHATYPPGFEFQEASPEPTAGNNVWDLSDLENDEERTISITGIMYGQEGEEKVFQFASGTPHQTNSQDVSVVLNSLVHTISLSEPFLQTRIAVNNQSGSTVSVNPGEEIEVSIDWENSSNERVDNVEIRTALEGSIFDGDSIEVDRGFFNSLDDTVVWDSDTNQDFATVNPGDSGQVRFIIEPVPSVSGGSILQNPNLHISATTAGRIAQTGGSEEVTNITETEVRMNTDVQVDGRTAHVTGPFTNAGPIPPTAEEETTYTLVFTLSNTSNTVTDAELRTTLPRYVEYLGNVSPSTESVEYNASDREIVWDVGTIAKGTGISGNTRELAVQVAFTPSTSHVGSAPQLTDRTELTGTDSYTGEAVSDTNAAHTTFLLNDTNIENAGRVVGN